ncbi:MAG: bifunctional 4-hydroxy-2-oxoglutarate aldolase/2-dehydro-3-deoxy-phosphogluconate aldolase [Succinivibrio sp.]
MDTLSFINQNKLVSISRQVYGQRLLECARRLLKGGIRCLEITFDQASPTNLKDTPESITLVKKTLGDQICVGAGTVMTVEQARAAKDAGADFALAPNTDPEVIREVKRLGMVAVPGALSPSEIAIAWNAGADIVKIFPIAQFGVPYLKAIRGPINHIPLMAVGGVSAQNVADFLKNGCGSAGIGSNIINRKRAEAGDFDAVEQAAREFAKAIEGI